MSSLVSAGKKESVLERSDSDLITILDIVLSENGKSVKSRHYDENATITYQGGDVKEILFIREGITKKVHLDEEGKQLVLGIDSIGDIIGLEELFADKPRLASDIAIRDCTLLSLPVKDFFRLSENNRDFSLIINRYLGTKLFDSFRQNINSSLMKMEEQLLFYMEFFSSPRFENISVTSNCMANLLGTSQRHVNRLISKIRGKGLDSYHWAG